MARGAVRLDAMDADATGQPVAPGAATVSFAPEDSSCKLLELERSLAAKDAIMEPGVMDSLRTYVASGGKPAAAIELLSENYRGYAQMSSLVCRWLELTAETEPRPAPHKHGGGAGGGDAAGFSAAVSPVAQFGGARGGDASAAATPRDYGDDDDTPQGGHPVARTATATPPLSVGGPRAAAAALHEWRGRVRCDETHFLEELIRRTFDPSKVDAVRGRPAWLERLLNSDRGRGVLFSLAERHPNCLLITIAIQHAWNHGHADEVRALGPAAASYFSIFHELLADLLRDLISAGDDEAARDEAARNIKNACCQSLATYLFAQMMLADLASGGDAGTARPEEAHAEARDDARMQTRAQPQSQTRALAIRVSQELEEAAAKVHGAATTRKIAPLFASTDADATATSAVGELLQSAEEQRQRRGLAAAVGSGSAASLPRAPLMKLHGAYFGEGGGGGSVASARASMASLGGSSASLSGLGFDDDGDRPTPAPLRRPEVLRALFDETFRWAPGTDPTRAAQTRNACLDLIVLATTAGEDERDEMRRALEATLSTMEATARGAPPGEECKELLKSPAAAAGVVSWVRSAMGNPEHYKQVHAGASNGAYLSMLAEAARAQARLREGALETITSALAAMGKGSSEELHLAALDVAVELVESGLVLPALEAATEEWSKHIDPSHLRYFAGEVLEVAGPPFGGRFAAAALRLLRSANARRGMTRASDEFLEQIKRQRARGALLPPLGKELDAFLDRIAGK